MGHALAHVFRVNEDAGGSEVVGDGCVGGVFGVTGEGTVGVPPVWLTV